MPQNGGFGFGGNTQQGGYPMQQAGFGGYPQMGGQMYGGGYNPMFGGIGGLGYSPMMGPGFGQPMGGFGGFGGGYGGYGGGFGGGGGYGGGFFGQPMGGFPPQMGGYNPMFGGLGGMGFNPMMGPQFGQPMGRMGGYGGGYGGPIDEGTGGGYPNQGPLSKLQQLMNPPVGKQITSLVPEEGMPQYGRDINHFTAQQDLMQLMQQMRGSPIQAAPEPSVYY
jgi:hypothetical protein